MVGMQHLFMAAALLVAALASPLPSAEPGKTVHIRDYKFTPASLTVDRGDRVTFVNDDDDAHTVTADDGAWDSEGLPHGAHWTRVFDKAGKVAYHCTVHPLMRGTVVVRAPQ